MALWLAIIYIAQFINERKQFFELKPKPIQYMKMKLKLKRKRLRYDLIYT